MQFLLRPLRHPAVFAPLKKSFTPRAFSTTAAFARSPVLRSLPRPTSLSKNAVFASKRFFTTEEAITARPSKNEAYRRLLYGAGIFGGTLLGINFLFNRETREGIPPFERQYLKETFTYTAMSVGMIAVAAKALHNVGWSYRLMAANPWMVLGVGLVGGIGTMMGTLYTDPDRYLLKHSFWAAFNMSQALVLAPLWFYSPAILARAGLYTVGIMGSIAYVAATAKEVCSPRSLVVSKRC
jgi:hypothetical protein